MADMPSAKENITMNPIRIFISSVQSEFAEERTALFDYLTTDVLFAQFFTPFLFEKLPAVDRTATELNLCIWPVILNAWVLEQVI
jgi:hypothetical protein